MTIEQEFGMLISLFGIFWSPLRFSLKKCSHLVGVACKLHNFIIDCAGRKVWSLNIQLSFDCLQEHAGDGPSHQPWKRVDGRVRIEIHDSAWRVRHTARILFQVPWSWQNHQQRQEHPRAHMTLYRHRLLVLLHGRQWLVKRSVLWHYYSTLQTGLLHWVPLFSLKTTYSPIAAPSWQILCTP